MKRLFNALLLLGIGFMSGCRGSHAKPDGSGTIECTQVQVAPQVPGRLLQLPPLEGMMLKKGELVAQIDPADYLLRRNEAQSALAQAQAQLDLVNAGARQEDINRAREQLREAEASAAAAQSDYKRIAQVFAAQSATQKQMDDAQAAVERTEALRGAAQQALAKLMAGSRKEEIDMAQAQVAMAKARLALAEKAVQDCAILAPMNGVVTTRSREEGEMVGVGTPLLTLSRLDSVWLSIYIPEARLPHVKLGQAARVKVDGMSTFFDGEVTFVSPQAEFTPRNVQTADERAKLVYRVKITLPNTNGIFKPGMPADGYLEKSM